MQKINLLALAVLGSLALSAYSALNVYSATTQTFNVGRNLVSVTASYAFSAGNSTLTAFPGDSNDLIILTVSNGHRTPSNVMITFNATDPADWHAITSDGAHDFPAPYTMTYAGQIFAPSNSPYNYGGLVSMVTSFTYTAPVGLSTISVYMSIANNASPNNFVLQWTAQPI